MQKIKMYLNKKNLDTLFELTQERLDPDITSTDSCIEYAAIINLILKELGIESSIILGYAAWRIGKKAHDVISHSPECVTVIEGTGGNNIHSWIEIENKILDFTTYQLKQKAQELDMVDGFVTNIKWCPNYLFVPKSNLLSIKKVTDSYKIGVFGYQKVQKIEANKIENSEESTRYFNIANEIKDIMIKECSE